MILVDDNDDAIIIINETDLLDVEITSLMYLASTVLG